MFDGLSLDPFALLDDGGGPAEVGVGGRHVAQRSVVPLVVVVLDERLDLGLEVAGQEVVLRQDAVLQGLVPALDLPRRCCACIERFDFAKPVAQVPFRIHTVLHCSLGRTSHMRPTLTLQKGPADEVCPVSLSASAVRYDEADGILSV